MTDVAARSVRVGVRLSTLRAFRALCALWALCALCALTVFFGLAPTPLLAAPAAARSDADAPWLAGPLQGSAQELLDAAGKSLAATEGDDVVDDETGAVVLFQDASYVFDETGRATFRRHWVYRVLSDEAVPEWSKLEIRWSPWHQTRPTVQGRIVAPDGRLEAIEEADVSELADRRGEPGGPAGETNPDRRRWLRVDLPSVETGSVVEVVTEVRDLGPAFDAGHVQRHYFVMFVPILHHRLSIDTSKRLPFRFGAHGWPSQPPEPQRWQSAERFRLVFDVGPMATAAEAPEGLPGEVPRWPHVAFSNGRSWQSVATRYAQLVDRSLRYDLAVLDPELTQRLDAAIAASAASAGQVDEEGRHLRALRILEVLRGRVRHDGSELEASPPGPRRLSEILETGRGNAVDLATLAVAALRRGGLPARPALINAGFGVDVERGLPGLGLFNHALVHIPAAQQSTDGASTDRDSMDGDGLWIDPGAPWARPDELPLVDQGRLALVAAPETTDLVLTPAASPEDNLLVEERHVQLADWGPGSLVERSLYRGAAEQSQRAVTAGLRPEARRRGYLGYVRGFHRASDLGRLRETPAEDLDHPFEVELEVIGTTRAHTDLESARLEIPVAEIARRLPAVFRQPLEAPRREEFVFHEPFVTEWRYAVQPPPGFEPGRMPSDVELTFGPATYRCQFRNVEGAVQGRLVFDVGLRRLTADQFERMHAALRGFLDLPPLEIEFVPLARHEADPARRIARLAQVVEANPQVPSHRVRLVGELLAVGLGEEAVHQARRAAADAPGWAPGPWTLGRALAHDALGRFAGPGADLEAARTALLEGRRLAPADPRPREWLDRVAAAERRADLAAPAQTSESDPDLHPDDPLTPVRRLARDAASEDDARNEDGAEDGVEGGVEDGADEMLSPLHPRERRRIERGISSGLDGYLERVAELRLSSEGLSSDGPRIDGARHLGYRIRPGASGSHHEVTLYVTLAAGGLRLAAHDGVPGSLGLEALDRVVRGDLVGARQWLEWAAEESHAATGAEADRVGPFLALWPTTTDDTNTDNEEPGAERLHVASAALAAPFLAASMPDDPATASASDAPKDFLPRGAESAESALRWLAAADGPAATQALAEALFSVGRVAEAAERAAELPAGPARRDLELRARVQLGEWDAVEELLAASASAVSVSAVSEPSDAPTQTTLRARGALEIARGDKAAAFVALRELASRDFLENGDAHRWVLLLLAPDVAPGTRDVDALVEHAATSTDATLLRRVGALLAKVGRIHEAHEHLVRAAELGGAVDLLLGDHYVLGRIAEAAGLPSVAARHYRSTLEMASRPTGGRLRTEADRDVLVYGHLAQMGLARLADPP